MDSSLALGPANAEAVPRLRDRAPTCIVRASGRRPSGQHQRFLQRAARLIVPFSLIRDLPDGLFETPNDRRERGVVEMLRRVLAHGCADSDLASTSSAATPLPLSLAPGVPERSRWAFSYDTLGQVTSGKRYWSDGTNVAGQQFEYLFDDIGNRLSASSGGNEPAPT